MVDLFVTDKIKKVLPKVKAFIQEELIPMELAILSKPFSESENH